MKKIILHLPACALLFLLLALLTSPALADSSTTLQLTFEGSVGNQITLSDVRFDPTSDFDGATTTYSPQLARDAIIFSTANFTGDHCRSVLAAFGFEGIEARDYDRTAQTPDCLTGYTLGTRQITRNGRPCTLVLVAMCHRSGSGSWDSNLNFLGQAGQESEPEFDSGMVHTFTDAADLVLSGHSEEENSLRQQLDRLEASGEDYLVWVTGHSRGAGVGNCLARLLIDRYGTAHVLAYLFAPPNVDRSAQDETATSRYNSIFNLYNPDDLVPYVPFDRAYDSWGYARWGVDLRLHTPASDSTLLSPISQKYREYTAGCSKDSTLYIDGVYRYFSGREGNGAAVRALADSMVSQLAPTPADYYRTPVEFKRITGGTVSLLYSKAAVSVERVFYDFIRETMTGDFSDKDRVYELIRLARGSYYNACDVQAFLKFALLHGCGIYDLDTFLNGPISSYLSTGVLKVQVTACESVIAHMPESYLAWMSLDPTLSVLQDPLPQNGSACRSEVTSGPVTAASPLAFYGDQQFSAVKTGDTYRLRFTYTDDGSPCLPYGAVTLHFAAPENHQAVTQALYVDEDGDTQLLDLRYDGASNTLSAVTRRLNGTLILIDADPQRTQPTLRLYLLDGGSDTGRAVALALPAGGAQLPETAALCLACYDEPGRMIGLSLQSIRSGTAVAHTTMAVGPAGTPAETLGLFLLDSSLQPICPSLTAPAGWGS